MGFSSGISHGFPACEARSMEAILVFDEAEGLFGRRNAEAASSVDKRLASMACHGGYLMNFNDIK